LSDQAMRYYERELAYIRKALGAFAERHPEHAAQLQINRSSVEDPNISRLIEGMALLTAKTEQHLDEQFPDLVQDLFSLLYPGMLELVPSYFPLRLTPDPDQLNETQCLPAGSLVSVTMDDEQECHFTTVADLNVYPFVLKNITAEAAPFSTLPPSSLHSAEAVIQLHLHCADVQAQFNQLELGDLEIYVNGFEGNAEPLIDLLLEHGSCITLSDMAGKVHREIPLDSLVNRATQTDFQWLSKHGNQFSGFDLLRDYFSYPDKSAYFKITDFGSQAVRFTESELILNIYVTRLPAEFLRLFDNKVFSLYTVPAINKFAQAGEPMQYDASSLAMPVICDAQIQSSLEVITVAAVYEIDAYGEHRLNPLYKQRYGDDPNQRKWQSRQRWGTQGDRAVEISVTIDEQELLRETITLALDLVCGNGRAPCTIVKDCEVTNLTVTDLPGSLSVAAVPTGPIYPDLREDLYWRFIALLNANFSSLLHTEDPVAALQSMLALCNQGRNSKQVSAVKALAFSPTVGSVQVDNKPIFSSGSLVKLTLDKRQLSTSSSVFGQVLNVFLQQFCSYDRFIHLQINHFGDDSYSKDFKPVQGSQLCL
jgi:type VI secretion system protein ImpG